MNRILLEPWSSKHAFHDWPLWIYKGRLQEEGIWVNAGKILMRDRIIWR